MRPARRTNDTLPHSTSSARALAIAALLAAACSSKPDAHPTSSAAPSAGESSAPPTSSSAASGGRDARWPGSPVTARHSAAGVRQLVLRAGSGSDAKVTVDPAATDIVVSGVPTTWGVEGEPSEATGGFVFASFGDTLLAATRGELVYIHFGVVLDGLQITVPPHVTVVRERMVLNQDPTPDLRPPGAPPRSEGRP